MKAFYVVFSNKCDIIIVGDNMFKVKDTIKFMLANIMFTLREYKYIELTETNPSHYHGKDTIEIHYIKTGTGKIIIGDEELAVGPGSFFMVPGLIPHTQIPDEGKILEKYSIYLLYDAARGFPRYVPYLTKVMTGVDRFEIYHSFDKALYELKNKGFGYNEIVVSCFKEIFVTLLRDMGFNNERMTKWNPDSLEFEIEEMFINEFKTITVDDMAKRCFMSVRDLQRFLVKAYNKSFTDLKMEYRMSFAANKLEYSNDSVSKIAEECGYSSSEHFSYAFKNYYKISPMKYKKEKLAK